MTKVSDKPVDFLPPQELVGEERVRHLADIERRRDAALDPSSLERTHGGRSSFADHIDGQIQRVFHQMLRESGRLERIFRRRRPPMLPPDQYERWDDEHRHVPAEDAMAIANRALRNAENMPTMRFPRHVIEASMQPLSLEPPGDEVMQLQIAVGFCSPCSLRWILNDRTIKKYHLSLMRDDLYVTRCPQCQITYRIIFEAEE